MGLSRTIRVTDILSLFRRQVSGRTSDYAWGAIAQNIGDLETTKPIFAAETDERRHSSRVFLRLWGPTVYTGGTVRQNGHT